MSMSDLHAELRAMHDRLGQILGMMERPREQRANAAVSQDIFDSRNRAHRIAAEEHFRRLEINEKRQSHYYNKLLIGVRLKDLGAVIESENAEFYRMFPKLAQTRRPGSSGYRGRA